jgi:hypothetical protein
LGPRFDHQHDLTFAPRGPLPSLAARSQSVSVSNLREKSSDASVRREMIGFAAQRLMALVEVTRRYKGAAGDQAGSRMLAGSAIRPTLPAPQQNTPDR